MGMASQKNSSHIIKHYINIQKHDLRSISSLENNAHNYVKWTSEQAENTAQSSFICLYVSTTYKCKDYIYVLRGKIITFLSPCIHDQENHICTFMTIQIIIKQRINKLANGDGEMSTYCFCRGTRFGSQHSCGSSQTPVTPFPRDLTPISGLHL